jgi:uncharacterized protein (DUF1810 family)
VHGERRGWSARCASAGSTVRDRSDVLQRGRERGRKRRFPAPFPNPQEPLSRARHPGGMTPTPLDRFVAAQDSGDIYNNALAELRAGAKTGHWMWFVFPQIAGLGRSPMAQRYAITGLDEAKAYLRHPILGARLREAAEAILPHAGARSAEAILGGIDATKLRSSMTLFARAAATPEEARPFRAVLDAFYGGEEDAATVERLGHA